MEDNSTSCLPQEEDNEHHTRDKVHSHGCPGSCSEPLKPRRKERSQLDDECALELQGWRPTLGNKKRKELGESSRGTGSSNKEVPKQQKRFREAPNEGRCAFIYGDKNAFKMSTPLYAL